MSVCLLYSQYLGRSRAFRWHIYWHDDTYTDMTHLYVSCASDLHPKSQVIFTFQLRSKAASTTTQLWSALLQCSLWRHRLNSRRFSSNRPGWPVLAQSGSDLPQRGQIRDFFKSDLRTFWRFRAKMYWNLIWKSHGFVPFGANLTHFGHKSDCPCAVCRMQLCHVR